MLRNVWLGVLSCGLVVALAGCAGGTSTKTGDPTPTPTPASAASKVFVERSYTEVSAVTTYSSNLLEFGTSASGTVTPVVNQSTTTEGRSGLAVDKAGNVYVGAFQYTNTSDRVYLSSAYIEEYASGFTANSAPIRTLSLPNADAIGSLAVDASGQVYALSYDSGTVYVFDGTADTPVRTIAGSNTGITVGNAVSVAVDSTGQIYVCDFVPSQVVVFASGANGNVAPSKTISITAGSAYGVALDTSSHLFVAANDTTGTTDGNLVSKASILEFDTDATGAATPLATITGSATTMFYGGGVQVDAAGNLWIVNLTEVPGENYIENVLEFAKGANGNVAPVLNFTSPDWQPYGGPNIAVE